MNPPSSQSSNNSLESSGDDETAMPFEGDFFGTARDYDGDNFGQLEDGHTDSNHEDSNSGLDEGLDPSGSLNLSWRIVWNPTVNVAWTPTWRAIRRATATAT